jgi:hypothetical protein
LISRGRGHSINRSVDNVYNKFCRRWRPDLGLHWCRKGNYYFSRDLFTYRHVSQENSILYRRYVTLHIISTVSAFSVALTWTILSASRHSTAQAQCEQDFFQSSDAAATSEGQILCNIFPWVDVGLMGGLVAFFAITQVTNLSSLAISSSGLISACSSIFISLFPPTEVASEGITKSMMHWAHRSMALTAIFP